jgi:hypothetical protein
MFTLGPLYPRTNSTDTHWVCLTVGLDVFQKRKNFWHFRKSRMIPFGEYNSKVKIKVTA